MNPKSIILLEDDINLRQSITLILERVGYLVTATDCVDRAMEQIQSGHYQLIITDINIPETEEVLLKKIQVSNPYLSVIILTDQSISRIEKEKKLSGLYYLEKPVAPEQLLDCVRDILATKINNSHKLNAYLRKY
jgi:DNA-binding NtrC family response regulator